MQVFPRILRAMTSLNSTALSRILYRNITEDCSTDAPPSNKVKLSSEPLKDAAKSEEETDQDCNVSSEETTASATDVNEIRGVIFDMDGTLTLPVINFKEMRSRLKLTPSQDILPTVQKYPPEERAKAMAIIEECEAEALKKLQVRLL